MNYSVRLLLLSFICICSGCSKPHGLIKTEFTDWNYQKFDYLNIQILLPEQHFLEGNYIIRENRKKPESKLSYESLKVYMHPYYLGSYMVEPHYHIKIYLVNIKKENYLKYSDGSMFIRSYNEFYENHEFHEKLQSYSTEVSGGYGRPKEWLYLIRKDYKYENGDYLMCAASIWAGSPDYILPDMPDIVNVMKIMESITFLN